MVSGMGTHTVRRVVTGSLWNLATLDFGLEMRMVEKVRSMKNMMSDVIFVLFLLLGGEGWARGLLWTSLLSSRDFRPS